VQTRIGWSICFLREQTFRGTFGYTRDWLEALVELELISAWRRLASFDLP